MTKISIKFSDAVRAYVTHKAGRRWGATSVITKTNTINVFYRHLEAVAGGVLLYTETITSDLLFPAVERAWPNDPTKTTHAEKCAEIKTMIRWMAQKYNMGDITDFLEATKKLPEVEKAFLTEEQKEYCVKKDKERGDYRDAYMLGIAWHLQRRGIELVKLKVKNFKLKQTDRSPYGYYEWIETKSGQGRQTWNLNELEHEIISEWLEVYAKEMGVSECDPEWYLFPKRKVITRPSGKTYIIFPTEPVYSHTYSFSAIYKRYGIHTKGMGTHSVRRGSAEEDRKTYRQMMNIIDPVPLIQRKLGHKRRETTEIYLNLNSQKNEAEAAAMELARVRIANAGQNTPEPVETPQEATNVVSFADRLARRQSAG